MTLRLLEFGWLRGIDLQSPVGENFRFQTGDVKPVWSLPVGQWWLGECELQVDTRVLHGRSPERPDGMLPVTLQPQPAVPTRRHLQQLTIVEADIDWVRAVVRNYALVQMQVMDLMTRGYPRRAAASGHCQHHQRNNNLFHFLLLRPMA